MAAHNRPVAKNSRVPSAVGAIPVVGGLMKQADNQAQWMQELIEQNARMVSQFPATMKNFNDSLERFNQIVARLDQVVSTVEVAAERIVGPLEAIAPRLERQVALLTATTDRVLSVLNDLPGAGFVRRIATGRVEAPDAG
jgi:uncharacterized protein YecE (DUF72 family)